MALLFGLTLLVAVSSAALAARLYPDGRTERALAACVLGLAQLQLVMQALGFGGHLVRGALAGGVALASCAALTAALAGPGFAARARTLPRAVLEVAALPWTALREAARARSPMVALGLVVTLGVVLYTTWLAWLAPTGAWDGVRTHETMAYLALQQHGFVTPPWPSQLAMAESGARTAENLLVWAAAFSGKTLVDATGLVTMPMAIVGAVALVRQHVASRSLAVGAALALVTIPGAALELRSTYVDLVVLATAVAAAHFATRRDAGAREAWLAALAVGLLAGTKANQLLFAGVLGAVAVARLGLLVAARRSAWPLAHGLGALVVCLALFAPGYARSWAVHRNPVWPIAVSAPALGLRLDGPCAVTRQPWPAAEVSDDLFGAPKAGDGKVEAGRGSYGLGLVCVAAPLFALALLVLARRLVRSLRARDRRAAWDTLHLLGLAALGAFTFALTPEPASARFVLGGLALLLVPVAWLLDGRARGLSAEAPVGAMIFAHLLTLAWAEPGWDVPIGAAFELGRAPAAERVYGGTGPYLFDATMRRLLEAQVHRGDVVALDDGVPFPANLWNEALDDRVVYVPFRSSAAYLRALDAAHAKWAAVTTAQSQERTLQGAPARWHFLGVAHGEVHVYARGPAPPGAPPPASAAPPPRPGAGMRTLLERAFEGTPLRPHTP